MTEAWTHNKSFTVLKRCIGGSTDSALHGAAVQVSICPEAGCGLSLATSWALCSHQSASGTEQVLPTSSPVGSLQLISSPILQHCNTEIAELVPEHPTAFAALYNPQTGNGVKWEQGSNTWRTSSLFKAAWMVLWSRASGRPLVTWQCGLCRPSCCRLIPGRTRSQFTPLNSSDQNPLALLLESLCLWQHQPLLGQCRLKTYLLPMFLEFIEYIWIAAFVKL